MSPVGAGGTPCRAVDVIDYGLSVTNTDADCDWLESSFEKVIAYSHKVPRVVWGLGKTLANTLKAQ